MHHAHTQGEIDTEEPHITGKTIQHPAQQGLLPCKARQLSVGTVTEVGQHQTEHPHHIMRQIREIKHPCGGHPKEDGDDRHGIGMDVETLAQQGYTQAHRTVKVNI